MRLSRPWALLTAGLAALAPTVAADHILSSSSLNPCTGYSNVGFTVTLFNVNLFADNNTVCYEVNIVSTIEGYVLAQLEISAYGYLFKNVSVDPCSESSLNTLCPLDPAKLNLPSSCSSLGSSLLTAIPSVAYSIPDLDATVRATVRNATTGVALACVEANLSNGKTVDQTGVKWATAVVAGIALFVSAVVSGLGHSNAAAHVAANAISLFCFFQSLAIFGMTAVNFPPLAQAWVQDFEWTMGIIRIGFMQTVLTWYQRATGGTPSIILTTLAEYQVIVQKRSLDLAGPLMRRGLEFAKRDDTTVAGPTTVAGIERVGFRAGIEPTNIFLTGLGIFVAFTMVVVLLVALFKALLEFAVRMNWIKPDQFQEFRTGWKVILKGILFRIILLGYAQMSILCLWELTVRDSVGEVVTAIFYFCAMTIALIWAGWKVIRLAQRSQHMHKNPAYILYSDPAALNKWGFLYVQFRATAYYFVFPQLAYILLKSVFVAFAQDSVAVQAIGILIIEALWLITVCVLRPWMDKKTNFFNVSIAVVTFISAVFILIFSDVFNQPELMTGIVGILFFLLNAIFGGVLIIMVILASGYAIFSKNPDTRYQPMRDDRGSFIKSQTNLNTELDALGATARGDMKMKHDLDEESSSLSDVSGRNGQSAMHVPLPASGASSMRNGTSYGEPPRSPISTGTYVPAGGPPRHATPTGYSNGAYGDNGYAPYNDRANSLRSDNTNTSYNRQPQQSNGANQWQRGAGYDH